MEALLKSPPVQSDHVELGDGQRRAANGPRNAFDRRKMRETIDQGQRYNRRADQHVMMMAAEVHKFPGQDGFRLTFMQLQQRVGQKQPPPANHVRSIEATLGRGHYVNFVESDTGFLGQFDDSRSQLAGRKRVTAQILELQPKTDEKYVG